MLGNTPMMRQYQEIKKQYPDTILFFRLGDFYEMFGPDAELASRELEITLTGRDAGMENRVPMCGVPYHAADNYLARLVQKGYKVAVCEQAEDPRLAKGIVKREVIRVITPGTTLDNQILLNQSSNYLAALQYAAQVWGLAFCDVSTGEFCVSEFGGSTGFTALRDELCRINPAEILVPEDFDEAITLPLNKTVITYYNKQAFNTNQAINKLKEHFSVSSLENLGHQKLFQSLLSAGAILSYLEETQKAPPQQIKRLKYYFPESYMLIDATTFRNLEITRTIRFNDKKGSLLDIMDKTRTAAGSRLLRLWLERPLTDRDILEDRLSAVQILAENWSERHTLRKYMDEVYDLQRLITRILYLRAMPKELIAVKNSLAVLPSIKTITRSLTGSKYLENLSIELDTLEDLYNLLDNAVEEDPPHNLKEGGVIKTGYDTEVDSLRKASQHGKEWIARLECEEKEKTGIRSLKVGFNKVFGYYLEVTKANLSLVPEYFQRKQTLANGERYITEELVRLENQVLGAEEKLLALEEEIYKNILRLVGEAAGRIQDTANVLAQIDVLQSLAEIAVQNGYIRPILLPQGNNYLKFKDLRHPVVEKLSSEVSFVPNDLEMDTNTDLYIITGPNMGGKSTFCRSAALAIIMAQAGSFVPAKEAHISLRDRVFARVGASDDLSSGQSTFMVEMNEVANILYHATDKSLVILDEVGRGTSTYDGLSMAWAVSEYLVKKLKTKALFATHYHELTQLEQIFPNIKNLSLSVKEKGEEIIFLYKIVEGPADKSYGIQVGRLAGLPSSVIARAGEILNVLENEHLDRQNIQSIHHLSQDTNVAEYPPEVKEWIEMLSKTDVLSITPIEALNRLYQLQQLIAETRHDTEAK